MQIAYQASSAMLDKVKQENATLAQQNQILTARIEAKDKTVVKIPNKIKSAILKDENTKALSNSPKHFHSICNLLSKALLRHNTMLL